jgi:rhodanese-related sulfurtransferase
MKKAIFIILIAFMTTTTGYSAQKLSEIPRISSNTAFSKFSKGNAILIDANPESTYHKIHVLGSVNLPNDGPADIQKLRDMSLPFNINDEIIVYCM